MTPEDESLVAADVQWERADYLALLACNYFSRGQTDELSRHRACGSSQLINARGALVRLHCFPTQGFCGKDALVHGPESDKLGACRSVRIG
jgi:hypothetical protein